MGPAATSLQLERIAGMVDAAVAAGATVRAGGRRATEEGLADGLFYKPTVLADIQPDSVIAQEEVFGPVLGALTFETESESIAIANGTRYALAAGVWTRDVKRAHRMARALNAGTVWINTYRAVSPLSPFGGSGLSGYGRENGSEAINQYTKTKSIWIELSDEVQDPFVLRV